MHGVLLVMVGYMLRCATCHGEVHRGEKHVTVRYMSW